MDRKQPAYRSRQLIETCSLARAGGVGCQWCGTDLPKRRRTWCSDKCSNAFWTNHWWSLARRAAKRRDKYRCKRCGERAPKRGMPNYSALRKTHRIEVNHIEQAKGRHGQLSCIHHLANLETLCLTCHKAETKRQAGIAAPRRSR